MAEIPHINGSPEKPNPIQHKELHGPAISLLSDIEKIVEAISSHPDRKDTFNSDGQLISVEVKTDAGTWCLDPHVRQKISRLTTFYTMLSFTDPDNQQAVWLDLQEKQIPSDSQIISITILDAVGDKTVLSSLSYKIVPNNETNRTTAHRMPMNGKPLSVNEAHALLTTLRSTLAPLH